KKARLFALQFYPCLPKNSRNNIHQSESSQVSEFNVRHLERAVRRGHDTGATGYHVEPETRRPTNGATQVEERVGTVSKRPEGLYRPAHVLSHRGSCTPFRHRHRSTRRAA